SLSSQITPAVTWLIRQLLTLTRPGDNTNKTCTMCACFRGAEGAARRLRRPLPLLRLRRLQHQQLPPPPGPPRRRDSNRRQELVRRLFRDCHLARGSSVCSSTWRGFPTYIRGSAPTIRES